ncbi:unnamed protein product [Mucor hiemalis]
MSYSNEQEQLETQYLKSTYKPSFTGFSHKYKLQVKSLSTTIPPLHSATGLQKYWCDMYNQILQVDRPTIPLANPTHVMEVYSQLFQYVKALNEAEDVFEAAAIQASLIALLPSLLCSRTTQIDHTSEDESVAAEFISSYRVILNSQAAEFKEEDEIFKSLTSGCIHMANECCQTYYKAIFIQNQNEAILRKCEEMRNLKLNEGQTKINKVFDALLPCRFHRNTEKALIILDDWKSAEKDKKSLFYVVLCILYNTSCEPPPHLEFW